MPTNFAGIVRGNYTVPRHNPIKVANAGFAFSHASECITLGLRKNAVCTFTQRSTEDMAMRTMSPDGYDFKLEADLEQTTMPELKNIYLLTRAFHQLRFRVQNGMYINMVDNTATSNTFASPSGSALVGMEAVFSLDDKERTLKCTWETLLADTEFEWLLTESTAAQAGGSSGTSLGLTAASYDYTKKVRPGIHKITIGGTSYGIGIFKEPKMTLKFVSVDRDHMNRPLTCFMDAEIEVMALQSTKAEILAGLTAARADKTIIVTTRNDETFTFSSGAISTAHDVSWGDDKTYQKLRFKGRIPYNIDDTSPDSLTWASTALTAALIGYS